MEREMTAIGAAALAGLGVGIWRDPSELSAAWRCGLATSPPPTREQPTGCTAAGRPRYSAPLL